MNSQKKYGLIIPKKNVEKKKPTISSVFGDDSSDSDKDTSMDWKKKAFQAEAKKGIKKQTQIEMDRALADDPTVYQYDEIYDEIDKNKADKIAKKKDDKKPRYIQSLLKQAERRKQEVERRNEREVQKEREKEGAQFGDKETFVTSSYRKKLEEFKKLDEEERRMDMLEDIGDVSKQQDLGGFYRHLYQTTVAEDKLKDKDHKKSDLSSERTRKKGADNVARSVDDSVADSSEIDTKKKTSRTYRKRKSSETEEEEEKGEKKKNKKEMEKEDNPDADTSSESDGTEEGEIIEKKPKGTKEEKVQDKKSSQFESSETKQKDTGQDKELNLEDKVKTSLDKILEEKKRHLEMLIKEEEEREKENEEEKEKKKKKVNVWEKRTVGEVFEGALQRYLLRKAEREANKG